jgi:hypothetical protein
MKALAQDVIDVQWHEGGFVVSIDTQPSSEFASFLLELLYLSFAIKPLKVFAPRPT